MTKRQRARRRQVRKVLVLLTMLMTVALVAITGTVAWLTAQTDTITNVFTQSDINVALAETTTDFKMVPGADIAKDPTVTVKGGSEKSYLFVQITKNSTYDTYLEQYEVDSKWKKLADDGDNNKLTDVYWIAQPETLGTNASDVAATYPVLDGNKVKVLSTVTKTMMADLVKTENPVAKPTLAFKAYAIQQEGFANADAAWVEAQK